MDELSFPASSRRCPSAASLSIAGHRHVLQGWLGSDDWLDLDEPPSGVEVTWGGESSRSSGYDHLSAEPAAPALKRRCRKQGSPIVPALCHVQAERQRREKFNRLFCDLRAAVPTVSRMDKASVLADATAYIAQLHHRIKRLEAEAKKTTASAAAALSTMAVAPSHSFSGGGSSLGEKLEVQMVGTGATMLRLTTTTAAHHAPARLMLALRLLDLPVQHASVCHVGGMTVQDAVAEVPAAALRDECALRAALLRTLQRATCALAASSDFMASLT